MEQQGSSLLFESESKSESESEGAEFFSDSFSTGSTPRLLSILLLYHDLSAATIKEGSLKYGYCQIDHDTKTVYTGMRK